MNQYRVLPKNFEDIFSLPNGDLWLYSNCGYSGDSNQSPEYKVYSNGPDIWQKLKAWDGVTHCCSYTRIGVREPVGHDFIVQSYAAKDALLILGWKG
jgi:hypothetical protein